MTAVGRSPVPLHASSFPAQFPKQFLNGHFGIIQYVFQDFRRYNFSRVHGHCGTTAGGISVNLVAAFGSGKAETAALKHRDDLSGGYARQARAHTVISNDVIANDSMMGISSPQARRSSMCSWITSRMFSIAFS